MSVELPAVISASPRPGGNSDRAAAMFAQGVAEALGVRPPVTMLRRFEVLPCQACYRCEHDPDGLCYLGAHDQSGVLFQALMDTPYLFLTAPIFFYHLPAQLKCLVDRTQSFWLRKQAGDPVLADLPRRPAYVCLVAGRPRGDKLFEGSLLTLKYFLDVFNFEIVNPLTLQGLEGAGELAAHPDLREALVDLGRRAAG
ncbi:flavodoxin family protein [Desulfocurvus sp. DL9XJH121]